MVLGEIVVDYFFPLLPQASISWKARKRESLFAVMVFPLPGSVTLAVKGGYGVPVVSLDLSGGGSSVGMSSINY